MSVDLNAIQAYQAPADLLSERVILITGAADGIGRALSRACAAHGATVVLLDKEVKLVEAAYDEIEAAGGPQPAIYPMNLEGATAKDYSDLAENIDREFGRLDGLVNNAGWIATLGPFKNYDIELWSRVLTVNLHAPFLLTRACLPLLERASDPSIVFSTHDSQAALWGAYGVAKAGQEGMIKILAAEYTPETAHPMRINGVDTGPVATRERRAHHPDEAEGIQPVPDDVVGPYLFFLGSEAGRLSGRNIHL